MMDDGEERREKWRKGDNLCSIVLYGKKEKQDNQNGEERQANICRDTQYNMVEERERE